MEKINCRCLMSSKIKIRTGTGGYGNLDPTIALKPRSRRKL